MERFYCMCIWCQYLLVRILYSRSLGLKTVTCIIRGESLSWFRKQPSLSYATNYYNYCLAIPCRLQADSSIVAIVCSLILRHSHFTTWPEKERLLFFN